MKYIIDKGTLVYVWKFKNLKVLHEMCRTKIVKEKYIGMRTMYKLTYDEQDHINTFNNGIWDFYCFKLPENSKGYNLLTIIEKDITFEREKISA